MAHKNINLTPHTKRMPHTTGVTQGVLQAAMERGSIPYKTLFKAYKGCWNSYCIKVSMDLLSKPFWSPASQLKRVWSLATCPSFLPILYLSSLFGHSALPSFSLLLFIFLSDGHLNLSFSLPGPSGFWKIGVGLTLLGIGLGLLLAAVIQQNVLCVYW